MAYVSGVPSITGSQVVGGTLTASAGNIVDDVGIDASTITVQWWRGNTIVQSNLPLPAAYVTVEADIAKSIYCRFYYDTDEGSPESEGPIESRSAIISTGVSITPPEFIRKNIIPIDADSAQGRVWNWVDKGNYVYAAANDDGIYTFDITVSGENGPNNPVQLDTVKFKLPSGDDTDIGITDVKIQGDYLLACGRKISWDEVNGDAGIFAVYDISTPATPVWLGSYQPSSMNPRPLADFNGDGGTARYGDVWYQGMTLDPNDPDKVMLASQFDGLTILDFSLVTPNGSAGIVEIGSYDKVKLNTDYALVDSATTGTGTNVLNDTGTDFTAITDLKVGDTIYNSTAGFFAEIESIATNALGCKNLQDGGQGASDAVFGASDNYLINKENFIWETSRIHFFVDTETGKDMVSQANHGNGTMLVDVSDKTNPIDAVSTEAPAYEPLDGDATVTSVVQLRGRMVIVENGIQYSCNNIGGNANRPERGLLTLDVKNYKTLKAGLTAGQKRDFYNWAPIGEADKDIWNGKGDQPILGLFKNIGEPFVYLANGQKGTAVFYVGDPLQPQYLGLVGTNIEAGTNLYMSYQFTRLGKKYMWYADAYDLAPQLHNLYIDEATMTDYIIGYPTPDALGPVSIVTSVTNTINYSSGMKDAFNADVITEEVEVYSAFIYAFGANELARMAIYNSELSGEAGQNVPIGNELGWVEIAIPATDSSVITEVAITPFNVPAQSGRIIAVARSSFGTIILGKDTDLGTERSSRDDGDSGTVDPNGWPNPWVEDQISFSSSFIVGFRARSIPAAGSPTLTTPYTGRSDATGTSSSVDLSTNWSGATSYVITGLPTGAVQVGSTGVVNFTLTTVERSLVTVVATNSDGSSQAGFNWNVYDAAGISDISRNTTLQAIVTKLGG